MICKECGGTIHGAYCLLCELFAGSTVPGGHGTTNWPMVSEALAVHPHQVAQANERNRRNGVNVEYDGKGFAHIPDKGNYAKILKLEGFHNKAEGYHGA